MIEAQRRKIGDIAYEAGGQKYLDLPKDFPYQGLNLRLAGRLVISGGTTSGTPWEENPMTLIERLRVFGTKAGGAVEIINCDAATLRELDRILTGAPGEITTVSAGAAATYDFVVDIEVPLSGVRLADEAVVASMLPGWIFDNLQIEIKWRDGISTSNGGLISGGDRTLALTAYGSGAGSPSISVMAKQALNIDPQAHNPVLCKIYKKTLVTENQESSKKDALNKGNYYRGLLFKAYTDSGARALSNSFLSNLKLLISGNAKEDWPFMQLRAENKREFTLETLPNGYAILDFVPNGDPSTMLDSSEFSVNGISFETELNIASAASGQRVDVVTLETVPAGLW